MGLDWCLKSEEHGKSPLEFIGAKRLKLDDPQTVEVAKAVIASHREAIQKDSNPNSNEQYVAHWSRPDEEVLHDMEGTVLVDTVDLAKYGPELPALQSPFSCLSGVEAFRGKRVEYCELIPDELKDRAFNDMNADEMLEYAGALEHYIPKPEEMGFDYEAEKAKLKEGFLVAQDPTIPETFWDVNTLKEAVEWLRFWAQFPVRLYAWY